MFHYVSMLGHFIHYAQKFFWIDSNALHRIGGIPGNPPGPGTFKKH